jgi:hypothetical protein
MKNLFERETVDEIVSRIDKLQPTSQRHAVAKADAFPSDKCDITLDATEISRLSTCGRATCSTT